MKFSRWIVFWSFNFFSFTCSFMFMNYATVSSSAKRAFDDISDDELNWLYSTSLIAVCVAMIPYAYVIETTQKTYFSFGSGVLLVVAAAWLRYLSTLRKCYAYAVLSSAMLGCGNAVALVMYVQNIQLHTLSLTHTHTQNTGTDPFQRCGSEERTRRI